MRKKGSLIQLKWNIRRNVVSHINELGTSLEPTMKTYILILLTFFFTQLFGQTKYVGKFCDNFGSCFEIKADSTFDYRFNCDLIHSWSKGIWKTDADTLYFKYVPIYDNLKYQDSKIRIDTLILSPDEYSETIKPDSTEFYIMGMDGPLFQNRIKSPRKLFYKNDKLFEIAQNGKLIRKKAKHILNQEKYHPWYIKK
jgi:hypothetical protein